ncbi:MAG: hypothetical protein C4310_13235, partial [Chloroflexota bacterium]
LASTPAQAPGARERPAPEPSRPATQSDTRITAGANLSPGRGGEPARQESPLRREPPLYEELVAPPERPRRDADFDKNDLDIPAFLRRRTR